MGLAPSGLADFFTALAVEPGEPVAPAPPAEVGIDRRPLGAGFGPEPPVRAGFEEIQDGVEDGTQIGAGTAAFFSC